MLHNTNSENPKEEKFDIATGYLRLIKNAQIEKNTTNGILTYIFGDSSDAEKLANFLNSFENIKALGKILVTRPFQSSPERVIISRQQYEALLPTSSYDKILNTTKLWDIKHDLITRANEEKISQTEFKEIVLNTWGYCLENQLTGLQQLITLVFEINLKNKEIYAEILLDVIPENIFRDYFTINSTIDKCVKLKNVFENFEINIIEKVCKILSENNLDKFLTSELYTKNNILMIAGEIFTDKKSHLFVPFLNLFSKTAINEAALQVNSASPSILNIMIHRKNNKNIASLIQYYLSEETQKLLMLMQVPISVRSPSGIKQAQVNPIHFSIILSSAIVVDNFLKLFKSEIKNPALMQHDVYFGTPIHMIMEQYPESYIKMILKDINPTVINFSMGFVDRSNRTPLHTAALGNSEDLLNFIIDVASPEALSKACFFRSASALQQNIIDIFFLYQSPNSLQKLITKIDDTALQFLLKPVKYYPIPPSYITKFAELILNEITWQDDVLLTRLFSIAGDELAKVAYGYWLNGNDLAPLTYNLVKEKYKFDSISESNDFSTYRPVAMNSREEKSIPDDLITITTSHNTKVAFTNPDFIDIIWLEGLKNWEEFRLLRKYQFRKPDLAVTLERLKYLERVTQGSEVTLSTYKRLIGEEKQNNTLSGIIKLINEEKTALKIIKKENWNEFSSQIDNYQKRPALRNKNSDKTKSTHKYIHLTNQIVEYKHKRKKNKVHKYTKKTSATLISNKMNTSIFGEHDPGRVLTGLLLNLDNCVVKAFLTQDRGTYGRGWVGTLESVTAYAKSIEGINFTTIEDFREQIKLKPYKLNELLVKISRDAILAQVIVIDTPDARTEALSRSYWLRQRNINVPIIFYNRALHSFLPYLSLEDHRAKPTTERLLSELSGYNIESFAATIPLKAFNQLCLDSEIFLKTYYLSKSIFTVLLKLLTRETINSLASQKSIRGESALISFLVSHDDVTEKLIDFLDRDTLRLFNNTQLSTYYGPITPLTIIAKFSHVLTFNKFMQKIPESDLKEMKTEWMLDNILTSLPASSIKLYLEKAFDIFPLVDYQKFNFVISSLQTDKDFFSILSSIKFRKDYIGILKESISTFVDENTRSTPFHLAAMNLTENAFLALLKILGPTLTNSAFQVQNSLGETPLHFALMYQTKDSLNTFLPTIETKVLSRLAKTETLDSKSLLDIAIEHQPLDIALALLRLLDKSTQELMLFILSEKPKSLVKLAEYLIKEQSYLDPNIINLFLKNDLLGPVLIKLFEESWYEGNKIPPMLISCISDAIKAEPALKTDSLTFFLANSNEMKEDNLEDVFTSKGQKLNFFYSNPLTTVWKEGLNSWLDYYKLRSKQHYMSQLSLTLDKLFLMNKVLIGSNQSLDLDSLGPRGSEEETKNHFNTKISQIRNEPIIRFNARRVPNTELQAMKSFLLEKEAHATLLKLKNDLENNSALRKNSIFGKSDKKLPTTLRLVEEEISDAVKKSSSGEKVSWIAVAEKVESMLLTAKNKKSNFRLPETQKFYEDASKYFKR